MASLALNRKHAADHRKAMSRADNPQSKDYNKDHAKKHEDMVKEDQKMLKKRKKGYGAGS
jgi:hypothetical protein